MKFIKFNFSLYLLLCTKLIAQDCPPISVANLQVVTGSATNLLVGDILKSTNVIVYNGVAYDAIFQIKTLSIGSGATLAVNGTTNLLIRQAIPNTNPYVIYTLSFVPTGTDVSSGVFTPVSLPNISLSQGDVDGNNANTFSDMGGYSTANATPTSTAVGVSLENTGFLTAVLGSGPAGPAGFSYYKATLLSETCPGTVNVPNVQPTNPDYTVTMTYSSFTQGDFIFGMTGCGTARIGERAQNLFVNAPYSCPNAPTADNDESLENRCTTTNPISIDILSGDLLDGGVPATPSAVRVNFVLPSGGTQSGNVITVPNQGTWTYDPSTGLLTFLAASTLMGSPTPLQYTITELNTLKTSNTATVTVTCIVILPIRLLSFDANITQPKTVKLTWTTDNASAFSHFEIEKSQNSNTFYTIGTVMGTTLGKEKSTFTFYDKEVKGLNYYRLKMVDLDGSFNYSKIKYLAAENINLIITQFENSLKIQKNDFTISSIGLYDLSGKLIFFRENKDKAAANNDYVIPFECVKQGVYIVKINSMGTSYSKRIFLK